MKKSESLRKIAVFASGNGSNAENIINYFKSADCGIEVALVVCNKAGAGVIARAEALGVPVKVMTPAEIRDKGVMLDVLLQAGVDVIVLAGFLLMVPDFMLRHYAGRILNIHSSLLPKFGGKGMYGANVHRAVVAAGESETGITIHHVTDRCDEGGVIFQASVAVDEADTPETVEAKVHALERQHFARVIHDFIESLSPEVCVG